MKIGCVIDSVSRNAGGLFESVRGLTKSLQNANGVVTVFGLVDEYTRADMKNWEPLRVQTCESRRWGYSPDLLPALQAASLDVLLAHGLWKYTSVASRSWARRTGRPYIIHPHGMLEPWAVKNSRWKKKTAGLLFENSHLRGASCLRALCESEAQSMRAYGLRNPICVIPNGIDLPDLKREGSAPWEGETTNKKVLLYLGRLHPKKNLLSLIDAWGAIQKSEVSNQKSSEWLLAIAGWDQDGYEQQLKNLTSDLGLLNSVVFLGPLFGERKAAAYQHADAFVLPSLSEGLPMVVLEAWAFAKPVLMTPECNLPDGFRSEAALPLQTDVASISKGLQTLFGMSNAELKAMGGRGRALVGKSFNWPAIGEQMKAVCEWLVDGAPPPPCVRFN
jgi:glycosyltransferase involved in cell wall biosynthesis